jgi:hypothetical protein
MELRRYSSKEAVQILRKGLEKRIRSLRNALPNIGVKLMRSIEEHA